MSAPIGRVLDRLQGVSQVGDRKWVAKCPAHPDRTPSLSVAESNDGKVLLHDFAGCSTPDVLAALGLRFSDLFAPRRSTRGRRK